MVNFDDDQESPSLAKDLFAYLDMSGMLEYGMHIPGTMIREFLGIDLPEYVTVSEYKKAQLIELSAVSYVREALLDLGKYIKAQGDDYRILLPSENALQVRAYHKSADRKYDRAIRLSSNTPASSKDIIDHSDSRMALRGVSPRRFDGDSAVMGSA